LKPRRAIACVLASLASTASCATVLGIEDVEVEPAQGAGGEANAAAASGGGGDPGAGGCAADTQTDDANCGACGHDCLGGSCSEGRCQAIELASGFGQPWGLAVDATHIYWADHTGSAIARASKADGSAFEIVAAGSVGVDSPIDVAVDGDGVYFTSSSFGVTPSVMRCPLAASCGPTELAASPEAPTRIRVEGSYAYWLDIYAGSVRRADKATGAGEVKISTIDNGYLGGQYAELTIDDAFVYWTNRTPGELRRAPKGGGAPELLRDEQARPSAIVARDDTLYWANAGLDLGQGEILSMAKDGSGAITTIAIGQTYPAAIAVDATHVYWINEGTDPGYADGSLRRCARAGCAGPPEILLEPLMDPRGLALDDDAVYVTTFGAGKVWKVAK
jgi:hypothetical protein